MDRLRALEVFVEIADQGSLTEAARRLSLSAPTVTRILNELEQSLGAPLLHRTTRSVTLTDTGRNFLSDARKILEDFAAASDAARGAHHVPKGILKVTAPTLFGQHYIAPIMLEYLDLYPDVSVEALFVDRIVNIVEEGFDVSVRIGPLADSSMLATRVGAVRRVVCGSRSYLERAGVPQTPADLADHRIITSSAVSSADDWRFDDGRTVRVSPRLRFHAAMPAINAAKTGWGLTRVLSYQVGPDIEAGNLVTVLADFEPEAMPIHVIHPEGRAASAKVRAFVDLARERIRENPHLQL